MLIFLCRLEWRALTRDTRSIAAIMLLIICTAYGVYTGESWRQERERSITTVTTARMQSRDKQRAHLAGPQQASSILSQRPPVFAYFVEDEAVLPPMPVAGLSIGPGDALPHVARGSIARRFEINVHFGWFLEPAYDYSFARGHQKSLGISFGLLIGIR
jgi:hypothetical protein